MIFLQPQTVLGFESTNYLIYICSFKTLHLTHFNRVMTQVLNLQYVFDSRIICLNVQYISIQTQYYLRLYYSSHNMKQFNNYIVIHLTQLAFRNISDNIQYKAVFAICIHFMQNSMRFFFLNIPVFYPFSHESNKISCKSIEVLYPNVLKIVETEKYQRSIIRSRQTSFYIEINNTLPFKTLCYAICMIIPTFISV